MRSLVARVFATVLVLSTLAPALASADDEDEDENPRTQIAATVVGAPFSFAGFSVGDRVKATWVPKLNASWELKNRTTGKKAKGTVNGGDLVPPSHRMGGVVTSSTFVSTPGLMPGTLITIAINFSDTASTTMCGPIQQDQACLFEILGFGQAVMNLNTVQADGQD